MIDTIQLENYRCFENTKIKIKQTAIFVGKNNAGKSSLIEAFRLVAMAIRKSKSAVYKELPIDFGIDSRIKGFKLDVDKLKIDLRGVVYFYQEKNAKIVALLDSGNRVEIYLNSLYAYAVLYDVDKNNIKTKSKAKDSGIEQVSILPQLGLIKENEKILLKDTVKNDRDSYLFSRHFRNEVYQYKDEYWDEFVELAENTWKGLRIKEIVYDYVEDDYIRIFVSDSSFVSELGMMGSGLQMWLQIMWFLSRTRECSTIILDEPDVYMHPDLQRKLIRIIKKRYPQTIIATHSIEIMAEVDSKNIITIDKKSRKMSYATDTKAVQKIIDDIGSVSNLSLARIGGAKKCIFVEGEDLKLLAKFADVIYPKMTESVSDLPHVSLGGFNNLNEAFGASKLFYDETEGNISCICILDSDYFPKDLLTKKIECASENKLDLHIWRRKEIENYLLEPKVIFRLTACSPEQYMEFLSALENLVNSFENEVFDQYAEHIAKYRKYDISTANKEAREFMSANWNSLENKLALVSGKKMLKEINKWLKTEYGISCTRSKIIAAFKVEDISDEIVQVISKLVLGLDVNN